jgi:hypothetical protein
LPEVAPVVTAIPHVLAQLAPIAGEFAPILFHLVGASGPDVPAKLTPIGPQLALIVTDFAVVPVELPPILANVLPVLSRRPPGLGVCSLATQRQHNRSHRHRRQGLHRSLLARILTAQTTD